MPTSPDRDPPFVIVGGLRYRGRCCTPGRVELNAGPCAGSRHVSLFRLPTSPGSSRHQCVRPVNNERKFIMRSSAIKGVRLRTHIPRAEVLPQPDGTGNIVRTGTGTDGGTWTVHEIEIVDEARNKVTVRTLVEGIVSPGFYDLTVDVGTVSGAARYEVVHMVPCATNGADRVPAASGAKS